MTTLIPKRIVFVCVENSNRSQMAEAFARIHSAGKVEPFSASSRSSGELNPKAATAAFEELRLTAALANQTPSSEDRSQP